MGEGVYGAPTVCHHLASASAGWLDAHLANEQNEAQISYLPKGTQ